MGSRDPNPIPAWAVTMWTNDIEIFVAIPMKDTSLPPYIMSFPYSGDGIARALRILHERPKEVIVPTTAQPANYTKPAQQPQVRTTKAHERVVAESTESQRANAAALIARLGLKR